MTTLFLMGCASVSRQASVFSESFEHLDIPSATWKLDHPDDNDPYAETGEFFRKQKVVAPEGYRSSVEIGARGWLTLDSYARSPVPIQTLRFLYPNPDNPKNTTLRISSPDFTNATILRSTNPLPATYRICARIGFANFGNGKADATNLNGYLGGERGDPWRKMDATLENGFYWLTIQDTKPQPHNNVWIHHHRKVVIDSDNNKEAWTEIWTGKNFIKSGEHPVMMFALDAAGEADPWVGLPFISYSSGELQNSGLIRAADSYLENTWYRACIEKDQEAFTLSASGRFKYGGQTVYRTSIPLDRVYRGRSKPDYFMLGDPHINFYRGSVLVDDIELTEGSPRGEPYP